MPRRTSKLLQVNKDMRHSLGLLAAYKIQHISQANAPVASGFMRDNIKIIDTGSGIAVASLAPYSIYPHELMYLKHPVGKAKFLEDAAIEVWNQYKDVLDIRMVYSPVLAVIINSNNGKKINEILEGYEAEREYLENMMREMIGR